MTYAAKAIGPTQALLAGDTSAIATVRGHGQWLRKRPDDLSAQAGDLLLESIARDADDRTETLQHALDLLTMAR